MNNLIKRYHKKYPDTPYIELSQMYGVSIERIFDILGITNYKIYANNVIGIRNAEGNVIYREYEDGSWTKYAYDTNGNNIYHEYDNGRWIKYEYDDNGNLIHTRHGEVN